jgi:hypothetical protein
MQSSTVPRLLAVMKKITALDVAVVSSAKGVSLPHVGKKKSALSRLPFGFVVLECMFSLSLGWLCLGEHNAIIKRIVLLTF